MVRRSKILLVNPDHFCEVEFPKSQVFYYRNVIVKQFSSAFLNLKKICLKMREFFSLFIGRGAGRWLVCDRT